MLLYLATQQRRNDWWVKVSFGWWVHGGVDSGPKRGSINRLNSLLVLGRRGDCCESWCCVHSLERPLFYFGLRKKLRRLLTAEETKLRRCWLQGWLIKVQELGKWWRGNSWRLSGFADQCLQAAKCGIKLFQDVSGEETVLGRIVHYVEGIQNHEVWSTAATTAIACTA